MDVPTVRRSTATPWNGDLLRSALIGIGFFCLFDPGAAWAADAIVTQVETRRFPVKQVFTFLFPILGPFKIIGPFAAATKGADPTLTRRIALWATLFSSLALLIAAFLGEGILSSYGIPLPVLSLAAGLILFLVALVNILQQFRPTQHDDQHEDPSRCQP